MRSFSRPGLGAITAVTMIIATFPLNVFSVLAAELIAEFNITRGQVGLLVTATGTVGALASPIFGRVTDRMGGVASTRAVLAIGVATLTGVAVAPVYGVLLLAALAAGIPNGWGNPATNALIVDNVPSGSRGILTGVKQSGVQVGTFLGGLLLPAFAALWDWRLAVALFVIVPLSGLLALWDRRDFRQEEIQIDWGNRSVPTSVRWVAAYGTLAGMATSSIFAFLPLFAEEDQLWSAQAAGSLIALIGLVGIAARILWTAIAERRLGHRRTLRILALMSTTSATILVLAATGWAESWVLVPAALLLAAGSIAWNAVGMLAVMDFSTPAMVGKGTGLVLLGFLLGWATGAPLMGVSVDALGTYAPGWTVAAGLLLTCAVIAGRIRDPRIALTGP